MAHPYDSHFKAVTAAIRDGRVVPFFGAGVNLCGCDSMPWLPHETERLPKGNELSLHLVQRFLDNTQNADPTLNLNKQLEDLARVAQEVVTELGGGPLHYELRRIFAQDFPLTSLHRFFADLPRRRNKLELLTSDMYRRRLLIVTTNYDDQMERAFQEIEQEYHVISYFAEEGEQARFLHWPPGNRPDEIRLPNTYKDLDVDENPVLLKIHGAVDRDPRGDAKTWDSFVITEDHYVDYLSFTDVTMSIPPSLRGQLARSNFLFLGYGMRDWNLRALLRRIWREQKRNNFKSWAVLQDPSSFERKYWGDKGVELIPMDLSEYVKQLNIYL
jgi:hypothetical protein